MSIPNLVQLLDFSRITDDNFWDLVHDDGGDLRATTVTNAQLPMHLLQFNKVARTGLAFVRGNGDSIRLWCGTGESEQPAHNSTYGSEAVYDNTVGAAWPLLADLNDATSNERNLTGIGDPITFPVDDTLLADATPASVVAGTYMKPAVAIGTGTAYTIEFWSKISVGDSEFGTIGVGTSPVGEGSAQGAPFDQYATPADFISNLAVAPYAGFMNRRQLLEGIFGGHPYNLYWSKDYGSAAFDTIPPDGWHHTVLLWDSVSRVRLIVDGSEVSSQPGSDGDIDISAVVESSPWILFGIQRDTRTTEGDPETTEFVATSGGRMAFVHIYTEKKTLEWAQARYNSFTAANASDLSRTIWPN